MSAKGVVMNDSFKRNVKAGLLAAAVGAFAAGQALAADMPVKAPPPKPVPFFFVNDTSVSFTYYANATDPGVSGASNIIPGGTGGLGNTFARYQASIDHFDVWHYGTNFIHAEFNQYGNQDPNLGIPGSQGSREFFGFARSTLGFNELTGTKTFTTVFTKDVSLYLGGTGGVQNNYLSEETTQGLVGLQFALALPGVVNVAVGAYKEFSHNTFESCGTAGVVGVAPGVGACAAGFGGPYSGDRYFNWTWKVESLIIEPLTFLPDSFPITWQNILNVTGPKGTGISTANLNALGPYGFCCGLAATMANQLANNETKTEVFEDTRLSLDTSKVFWGKPGIWDTYVGYRYWYNKFGTDHSAPLFAVVAPGTSIESTVYVGTTYHFK
jgi:hypothetical protein